MSRPIRERVAGIDPRRIEESLRATGYALTPPLLDAEECADLVAMYDDDRRFRKRIIMERLRFGSGDYSYFAKPLPRIVAALRAHAYRLLAPIANRWMEALGRSDRFPSALANFLAFCGTHGQKEPTPLLLRYREGGYNCLHQDVYGEVAFPLQITCFLSRAGVDFGGGEFLLVEQRPRSQSRGEVVPAEQGAIVIFPNGDRPVAGAHGFYRVKTRHGVSRVTWGSRYALGIIFHDAR